MYKQYPYYMFFDVESVGLYGEGYAVGFIVVDGESNAHDQGGFSCSPANALSDESGRLWVERNAPKLEITHAAPWLMRAAFWRKWQEWKQKGAVLVGDVNYPVESYFLWQCVNDDRSSRALQGPYPLLDVGSIIFAKGFDPLGKYKRDEFEFPIHNPLMDARQTSRIFFQVMRGDFIPELAE